MSTAPGNWKLEEVQRFSRFCTAFLADGSEIKIDIQDVCGYSIEGSGIRLKVLDSMLTEKFVEAARRFRKPGTLVREVKDGVVLITFPIRRG